MHKQKKKNWPDAYCCDCRSEVSFCVGTHLIPHPNKVSARCKPLVSFYTLSSTCVGEKVYWGEKEFLFEQLRNFEVLVFLKVDKGGEDAFFVSNYNGGVIAVADGVSGYEAQDSLLLISSSSV